MVHVLQGGPYRVFGMQLQIMTFLTGVWLTSVGGQLTLTIAALPQIRPVSTMHEASAGQEPEASSPNAENNPDSTDVEFESSPSATQLRRKQRRRAGSIGLVLLGLIAGIGIFLVAFIMIWGHRIRRIARQSGQCTVPDQLWFLRGRNDSNGSVEHEDEDPDRYSDESSQGFDEDGSTET